MAANRSDSIVTWNAKYNVTDHLWEVTHGDRWWTVFDHPDQGWVICNERLTTVSESSRLGRNIIAAIEAAQ